MWTPARPHCQKHFYIAVEAFKKIGRVDNGDAFLDTDAMEKKRGITIFSKQAELQFGDTKMTLWTPRDTWIFRQRWSGR